MSRVRLVPRMADVDAAAWDVLAADDPYARHGWLRTLEDTVAAAASPVYFLLEDGGRLTGGAIAYRLAGAPPSTLDELLLGRLAAPLGRLGISLNPVLCCGPLIGQGRHVLWERGIAARDRIIETLLDAMAQHAARERLSLAVVKLPAVERALVEALGRRGFAQTLNWPVSVLDLTPDSFDAWLRSLGSRAANKARREIAGPGRERVTLGREADFSLLAGELFALVEANHRAHSREPFGIDASFFAALARHHPGGCVVTTARSGTELTGAALILPAGRAAGAPLIGVNDDARNRRAFTYFNLAFYAPVRWCIEHGVERLWLGAGLYEMKRRRGCREIGLEMFVRHRSAAGRGLWRVLCALHRRWACAKLARQGVSL